MTKGRAVDLVTLPDPDMAVSFKCVVVGEPSRKPRQKRAWEFGKRVKVEAITCA